jgi:hypothetical protein
MKNIPQWFPGHERPTSLVEMMPRSVEGWRGIWPNDGLEPNFNVIFVSLALSDCQIMRFF